MFELGPEMTLANHLTAEDVAGTPLRQPVSTIVFPEAARGGRVMVEGYCALLIKELKAVGHSSGVNAKGSHERWTCPDRRDAIVPRNLNTASAYANAIL